jgi:hypothetical protein
MDGRAFLQVARRLAHEKTEADWRTAAGRSYYALMHEGLLALQRWGFPSPRRDQVHTFVRLRFLYAAHADVKAIGYILDQLLSWRNQADYRLEKPGNFSTALVSTQAVVDATNGIDRLDHLESDPARRAAAIAAIRKAFP